MDYIRYKVAVTVKDSIGDGRQEVTVEEYGYSVKDAVKAAKRTVRSQGYMGHLTFNVVEHAA